MKKKLFEEIGNTWTHLIGVVFALSSIWMVWPAVSLGWQWAMGVLFFIFEECTNSFWKELGYI